MIYIFQLQKIKGYLKSIFFQLQKDLQAEETEKGETYEYSI